MCFFLPVEQIKDCCVLGFTASSSLVKKSCSVSCTLSYDDDSANDTIFSQCDRAVRILTVVRCSSLVRYQILINTILSCI